jgi:hypothetical protein
MLVQAIPPGGGEAAERAGERRVLLAPRLASAARHLEHVTLGIALVGLHPDGSALVAVTDSKRERTAGHGLLRSSSWPTG